MAYSGWLPGLPFPAQLAPLALISPPLRPYDGQQVLEESDSVALADFTPGERVSVLATLAGAQVRGAGMVCACFGGAERAGLLWDLLVVDLPISFSSLPRLASSSCLLVLRPRLLSPSWSSSPSPSSYSLFGSDL